MFKSSFFVHFDGKLILYMNLDVNRLGFDAIIYHLIENMKLGKSYSRRFQIRLIFFFSRFLKDAEIRY